MTVDCQCSYGLREAVKLLIRFKSTTLVESNDEAPEPRAILGFFKALKRIFVDYLRLFIIICKEFIFLHALKCGRSNYTRPELIKQGPNQLE